MSGAVTGAWADPLVVAAVLFGAMTAKGPDVRTRDRCGSPVYAVS